MPGFTYDPRLRPGDRVLILILRMPSDLQVPQAFLDPGRLRGCWTGVLDQVGRRVNDRATAVTARLTDPLLSDDLDLAMQRMFGREPASRYRAYHPGDPVARALASWTRLRVTRLFL